MTDDSLAAAGTKPAFDERFFANVRFTSTCWVWTGYKVRNGYGVVSLDGHNARVHRIAYERLVGPIPEGLTIDHLCRNRACVRPDHLEAVTNRENLLRGQTVSAANARKTACIRGHPLSGENLLLHTRKDGSQERICRACQRLRYQNRVR